MLVALTALKRLCRDVTGDVNDATMPRTLLHWNVAQALILRCRAELIEQGWEPDAC